ncbi:magnesium transporter MgtE N-terminal domain-containing protein [Desulfobacterium sp. N47]|uniref:magnesium transporter MgtE N-terminal domain-containing protein n=1 Tax=Desulfobacterium sp. N47 TaxID=3115210 RepID=UPI003C8B191F
MAEKNQKIKMTDLPQGTGNFRLIYFSELVKRPICIGKIKNRIGKLTDVVFALTESYPEAVGIYIYHGWGKPTMFIPWTKVLKIEDDAIFVGPPEEGDKYPPFIDQQGWILLDKHLMGRTIVDMDDRRVEVVNDLHLIESRKRLILVHVDISFNGFLRRWGLEKFHWVKDDLISWKYVQPLSVEDAVSTDKVSLSVTRKQIHNLPSEDLADILEELSNEEKSALFSALNSEKAAETLADAEPRTQRQIIANLRKERARNIFSEMTIPQLAALFSVLPHDHVSDMMKLLTSEQAERVSSILSERESTAKGMMSGIFLTMPKKATVAEALAKIRQSGMEPEVISYIYVVDDNGTKLAGVVDLRELVLSADNTALDEIMATHVVTAEDDTQEDLAELFAKYHYRMIPVVDSNDNILGIIQYNDIMKGVETRIKL